MGRIRRAVPARHVYPDRGGPGGSAVVTFNLSQGPQGWVKQQGGYLSAIGCAAGAGVSSICAAPVKNGVRYFDISTSSATSAAASVGGITGFPGVWPSLQAPTLVRLKGGSLVTVMRGGNGHIYRHGDTGSWVDEGGAAREKSQIACVANNEQPLCFIQAIDGRIYWKKFGTAAGL